MILGEYYAVHDIALITCFTVSLRSLILNLNIYITQVKSVSSNAFSVCRKVGQPRKRVLQPWLNILVTVTQNLAPSRKRSFDPTSECVIVVRKRLPIKEWKLKQ